MTSTYRQKALDCLGQEYARLLDAVAEQLHHNESSHLHDLTKDVCSYCWTRAEQALTALRNHDFLYIVVDTDQESASAPYGWALWRPDGSLSYYLRADQVPGCFATGWDAIVNVINVDPAKRTEGWEVDPITEDDYSALTKHKLSFNHSGSREEFLTQTQAADACAAQGLPPVVGYAAWDASGKLIAINYAVRGLTGWHSLGMGKTADDVVLDPLAAEEHQHILDYTYLYKAAQGRDQFHRWRRHNNPVIDEEADTDFSSLARAFGGAIFDHGDADYGGTPPPVLGQYLEDCLSAYGAALQARQEIPT